MDKLPVELLQCIAEQLFESAVILPPECSALSKFSRTCRSVHAVLSPILYRRVLIENPRRVQLWKRTYLGKITPWVVLKPEWNSWVEQFGVRELEFWLDDSTDISYYFPRDYSLPLRPGLEQGLFRYLTSFLVYDFFVDPHLLASMMGPGTPLRSQLTSLCLLSGDYFSIPPIMLFLLEALEYLERSSSTSVLAVSDDELAEAEPEWSDKLLSADERIYPSCNYTLTVATAAQLEDARLNYPSFLQTLRDNVWPDLDSVNLRNIALMVPKKVSAFASLVDLNIHLCDEIEIALLLCTRICPHPPGSIAPPEAFAGDAEAAARLAEIDWSPLSERELATFPYPYRGPRLEYLSLESMPYI
ncbi:hypothetical protein JCM11251_006529 [Rhodosporidiobolus azoricus]